MDEIGEQEDDRKGEGGDGDEQEKQRAYLVGEDGLKGAVSFIPLAFAWAGLAFDLKSRKGPDQKDTRCKAEKVGDKGDLAALLCAAQKVDEVAEDKEADQKPRRQAHDPDANDHPDDGVDAFVGELDEKSSHHSGDNARSADQDGAALDDVFVVDSDQKAAHDKGSEIKQRKDEVAETLFKARSKAEEKQHIKEEMEPAAVQKAMRKQCKIGFPSFDGKRSCGKKSS